MFKLLSKLVTALSRLAVDKSFDSIYGVNSNGSQFELWFCFIKTIININLKIKDILNECNLSNIKTQAI